MERLNSQVWMGFLKLNPSNAEATFLRCTRTQKSLKTILILSCWYSLESSHWVLSDEYPFARVGFCDFSGFLHYFVFVELASSSIRVNPYTVNLGNTTSETPRNVYEGQLNTCQIPFSVKRSIYLHIKSKLELLLLFGIYSVLDKASVVWWWTFSNHQ